MAKFFPAARSAWHRRMQAAALLPVGYVALAAADSRTQLVVGASVVPVARLETLAAPSGFSVSAADLRRGYVAIEQPVRLRVYSNSRAGFTLAVRNLALELPGMAVSGLGQEVDLAGEGGELVQRWSDAQTLSLELHFRFALPEGFAPGTYPWPVQLRVQPLAGP